MYKDITADDKRAIRDAIYARLDEEGLTSGDDRQKRLIGSCVIYLLGATDDDKSTLTTGMGHDWYASLDDYPDGFTDLFPHPNKRVIPGDYFLVTTLPFEDKTVYSEAYLDVYSRRQLRVVVEVLAEHYPNWVDPGRATEVIQRLNAMGY
jgi:hypothetical protein